MAKNVTTGVMTIEGLAELEAKLKRATLQWRNRERQALEHGAKPLVDLSNNRAPRAEIEIRVVHKGGEVAVEIGFPKAVWYWRFLELGASTHEIVGPLAFEGREGPVFPRSVQHPGMAARPFLRNSYDETKNEIIQRMMQYIVEYLERA